LVGGWGAGGGVFFVLVGTIARNQAFLPALCLHMLVVRLCLFPVACLAPCRRPSVAYAGASVACTRARHDATLPASPLGQWTRAFEFFFFSCWGFVAFVGYGKRGGGGGFSFSFILILSVAPTHRPTAHDLAAMRKGGACRLAVRAEARVSIHYHGWSAAVLCMSAAKVPPPPSLSALSSRQAVAYPAMYRTTSGKPDPRTAPAATDLWTSMANEIFQVHIEISIFCDRTGYSRQP